MHIADVSYFVKPETALNEVALARATSVYLVQRVRPTVPRKLRPYVLSGYSHVASIVV